MDNLSAHTHEGNNIPAGAGPGRHHHHQGSPSIMVPIILDGAKLQIRRVPPHLRTNKAHRDAYNPVIVSMGPYHHGEPQCRRGELFKQESLDAFVSESPNGEDKFFFYGKILERVSEIRGMYEEVDQFDDQALAWLILQDACFLIYYMQVHSSSLLETKFNCYFGQGAIKLVTHDLLLVENQIPLLFVKFLLCLLFDHGEHIFSQLLQRMVDISNGEDNWFHFLEVYHSAVKSKFSMTPTQSSSLTLETISSNFRSITDLQLLGIHISSNKDKDDGAVSFNSSSRELRLPLLTISRNSHVIFCNLIAYEMLTPPISATSSNEQSSLVLAFLNFMKLLIQSSDDVTILREKGILSCGVHTDKQVFKVFKELDTFGCDNLGNLAHVRDEIERYCRESKFHLWLALLQSTYFKDPWRFIVLLQSIITLWLALIQTYFTVLQSRKGH